MEEKDLKKVLEEYLYALKLPTFVKNYQAKRSSSSRKQIGWNEPSPEQGFLCSKK